MGLFGFGDDEITNEKKKEVRKALRRAFDEESAAEFVSDCFETNPLVTIEWGEKLKDRAAVIDTGDGNVKVRAR